MVATKADLARPNTHEPETLRQPGGPVTHCYLCCEEWRDHFDERGRRRSHIHSPPINLMAALMVRFDDYPLFFRFENTLLVIEK